MTSRNSLDGEIINGRHVQPVRVYYEVAALSCNDRAYSTDLLHTQAMCHIADYDALELLAPD
jgi:hypothetical protein